MPEQRQRRQGTKKPVLTNTYLFQFDIIVKDSNTAPRTGWVFSTLVYDADAEGADGWDKLIPVGAMWGNDPSIAPGAPLAWIHTPEERLTRSGVPS